MIRKFFRAILVGSSETLFAVLLVGVLALVFFALFLVLFPNGTGLVDYYGGSLGDKRRADSGTPGAPGTGGPAGKDGPSADEKVAMLSLVTRRVKERRAEAVEWSSAREGMPIFHRQAIQTLGGSSAVVTLRERDTITLGENSLAVFTRPEAEDAAGARRASLVLMGGEVRGRVASAGEGVAIVTAAGETTVRSGSGGAAQFAVTVNDDKSSTFTLYAGAAEVRAEGRSVTLGPHQAVRVEPSSAPGEPIALPDPPGPIAPAPDAEVRYGAAAPEVEFQWAAVEGADRYRLVLARDERFADVLLDRKVAGPSFVHGNLPQGSVYWRVSSVRSGAEGLPGVPRSLRLVHDGVPPRLSVEFPGDVVASDRFVLAGRTEPGSRVFVGDEAIEVSATGEFRHEIALKRGVNMIVIEAVNATGNSAYEARYVTAKY